MGARHSNDCNEQGEPEYRGGGVLGGSEEGWRKVWMCAWSQPCLGTAWACGGRRGDCFVEARLVHARVRQEHEHGQREHDYLQQQTQGDNNEASADAFEPGVVARQKACGLP
jgi:hypothetical protein